MEPRCTQDFNRLQRHPWSTTPPASSENGRTQTLLQKDSDHDLKYSSPCLLQAFHKHLLGNGCGQRKALSQPMPPGAVFQIASMVVLRVLPWLVTASTQQQHSPSSTEDSQQGGVPVSQLALPVPLQCCGMSPTPPASGRLHHRKRLGLQQQARVPRSPRPDIAAPCSCFSLNTIKGRSSLSSENTEHIPCTCTSFQE